MTGDLLFRISYAPRIEVSLYIFVLEYSRETPGTGSLFKLKRIALVSKEKKKLTFLSRIFFQDEVFMNSCLGEVYQVVKRRWSILEHLEYKWRAFQAILPCCFCFSAKWAIQALHLLKFLRLFQGSILGQSLPAVCSLCLLLPLSWGTAPPSGPPACGGWGTGRRTELFLPLICVTQWKEQKDVYLYIYLSLSTYRHT